MLGATPRPHTLLRRVVLFGGLAVLALVARAVRADGGGQFLTPCRGGRTPRG